MPIDEHLPDYDVSERHATTVGAPADLVWEALWRADLAASPVVKALFTLRLLPVRLAQRGAAPRPTRRVTLHDLLALGFCVLEERPATEVVLGVSGRFWQLGKAPARTTAADFAGAPAPGTARAAWSFTITGEHRTSVLRTETRVQCGDAAALRSFRRYWRVVGPASGLIRRRMLASIRETAEHAARAPRSGSTPLAASYRIELARSADVPSLPGIERAAAAAFEGWGVPREVLDAQTSVDDLLAAERSGLLWVARSAAGEVAGFALVDLVDGQPHIEEIDVHPDHARRGVGRAMIRVLEESARAAGHRAITLTTYRDIPWNAPLYARSGFRVLTPAELGPELTATVAAEAEQGLDPARRVAMRREL